MKLTIKNTIEDYRIFLERTCNYVIGKNKIIFNILKILLYIAPWVSGIVQWEVIVNRDYSYISTFIFLSIIVDLLFYFIFKNGYPVKWLVNFLLIKIKINKFAICDKVLEVNEDYIKIYNNYGEIIFNKKDKIEIISLDECLIITNKKSNDIQKYILISNRSFKDKNEINQLINSIE